MTVANIDANTKINSDGWSPIIFRQTLETDDGQFQSDKVAYFRYRDSSFFDLNSGFRRATDDGKPPDDRIQIVQRQVRPTSTESFVVFSILSIGVIATAVAFFFEFRYRKSRYDVLIVPKSNQILLFALILLVAHSFAIPFAIGQSMIPSCSISLLCFILGFSLCLNSRKKQMERINIHFNTNSSFYPGHCPFG